ncbi:SCO6745 family protein [Saccharomonospora iraqiensis]|uniref:SCO6745 family protein n=1 Tax=Saccharomonospora iraqiensis TaxID=52698 RepID=UPI00022E0AAD|nr:hypothetical protein [Saccharomonospora iraqiensis]
MDRADLEAVALRCHQTLEPLHSMVYFAPEVEQAFVDAGLKQGRMCYFAGRAAPLGPVGAGMVTATFYNFSPELVARHVPRAWGLVEPDEVLKLRFAKAGEALRRLLGAEAADSAELAKLAGLVREAAEGCTPEGRPLYAAHADLDRPTDPVTALWHDITLLREFRGDGHIAALVAEGMSGLHALVTHTATGEGFNEQAAKATRGWSDAEWAAAETDLREQGVLDTGGGLTERGRAWRARIEEHTNAVATGPYRHIGPEKAARIAELGRDFARTALKAGAIPRELFDRS